MLRFLAGAAACFLFMTGAFLLWQGQAQEVVELPEAPPPRMDGAALVRPAVLPQAPEATPKSREQKRFSRADKERPDDCNQRHERAIMCGLVDAGGGRVEADRIGRGGDDHRRDHAQRRAQEDA